MNNACRICGKIVAVSLYLRVKPIVKGERISNAAHHFFGYWPPDSHLIEYIRREIMQGPILQQLFEHNCRGHSVEDITEAIEQKIPPMSGVPIKVLWNPGEKVTPYLLAETPAQRQQAMMEMRQDLRSVIINDVAQVKLGLLHLLNNTIQKVPSSISRPGSAIQTFDTPYAAIPWTPAEAAKRAAEIDAYHRRLWEQLTGQLVSTGGT